MSIKLIDKKRVVFTLAEDVENSYFDRRCRHGGRGIEKFLTGDTAEYQADTYEIELSGCTSQVSVISRIQVRSKTQAGRRVTVELDSDTEEYQQILETCRDRIESPQEPEPETLGEAAHKYCGGDLNTFCLYALNALLKSGKVSVADCCEAYESTLVDQD